MMQFLEIAKDLSLYGLGAIVGKRNVDAVLHQNGLTRTRNVGQAFSDLCDQITDRTPSPPPEQKINFLSTLTGNSDIFERFAEAADAAWKVCSVLCTLPGLLSIPDTIVLPDSSNVLGNGVPVSTETYKKVVETIRDGGSETEVYQAATGAPQSLSILRTPGAPWTAFSYQNFKIPWGAVTLYSSLSNDSIDFPCYPKEWSDGRKANYTTMPDLLYQYEPWQIYQSSGPRSEPYTFDFHRDMWTGDHRDGKANEMIRFCQACCYPEYRGAAVYTTTVSLYIHGQNLITGILTEAKVTWDTESPIGLDGVPLHGTLSLEITEVAPEALNYRKVRSLPIIG